MKKCWKGDPWTLDRADINALHLQLAQGPLMGHFLERIEIYPAILDKFAVELARKLPGLKDLTIFHAPNSFPLKSLRATTLIALGQFPSVVNLSLLGIIFRTFGDFARVVCAFSSLCSTTLTYVKWQRGEAYSLLGEPFAKLLRLQSIIVCAFSIERLDVDADI